MAYPRCQTSSTKHALQLPATASALARRSQRLCCSLVTLHTPAGPTHTAGSDRQTCNRAPSMPMVTDVTACTPMRSHSLSCHCSSRPTAPAPPAPCTHSQSSSSPVAVPAATQAPAPAAREPALLSPDRALPGSGADDEAEVTGAGQPASAVTGAPAVVSVCRGAVWQASRSQTATAPDESPDSTCRQVLGW